MFIKKVHRCILLLAVALNSSAETVGALSTLETEQQKFACMRRDCLSSNLSYSYSVTNGLIYFCPKSSFHNSYLSSQISKHFQSPKISQRPKHFRIQKIPQSPKRFQISKHALHSEPVLSPKYSKPSKFSQIFKSVNIPKFCHITKLSHIPKSYIPKVSIQAGAFMASHGRAQHINMNTLIGDDFSVSHQTSFNGLLGLGVYWAGLKTKYADFSYGLNAYYLPNTITEGFVTKENLYSNLSYSYSLANWPIYFGGKAVLNKSFLKKSNITLDAGIGFNVIKANGFKEYPLNQTTVPDTVFLNNTQIASSVTAGIGLRLNEFYGQIPLECGYRFFYLGHTTLKTATDQILDSLKTGNSYANALVCSITY